MATNDDLPNIEICNRLSYFVNKHMLMIIDLFKFLSENGFIVYADADRSSKFEMGDLIKGQSNTPLAFISKGSIVPDFIFWARQNFYVTPKLQKLIENDFIDENEKKYLDQLAIANQQVEHARNAVWVAAIALIASTLFQIFEVLDDRTKKVQIQNPSIFPV